MEAIRVREESLHAPLAERKEKEALRIAAKPGEGTLEPNTGQHKEGAEKKHFFFRLASKPNYSGLEMAEPLVETKNRTLHTALRC